MKAVVLGAVAGTAVGLVGGWWLWPGAAPSEVVTLPPPRCEQVPLPTPLAVEVEEQVQEVERLARQLQTHVGRPMPWSEADVPEALMPDQVVARALGLLDAVGGELVVVDCDENPCILAVEYPAEGPNPFTDTELGAAGKASWGLNDDDETKDLRIEVFADDGTWESDERTRGRIDSRVERVMRRLMEERE